MNADAPVLSHSPQDAGVERSVLVIDDAASVRATLVDILTALGVANVIAVDNGYAALDVLKDLAGAPCTVFCDLAMPHMDGVQVIRAIAEKRLSADIILMSGKDRRILDIVSEVAREAGHRVVGSIGKPFDRETVAAVLQKAVMQSDRGTKPVPIAMTASEIDRAIREERIEVVFEPQIDLHKGRVVGAEALARIRGPEGLIPPSRFIQSAESAGLIGALTEAVIRQATEQAGRWWRLGHSLDLAINLSASLAALPTMPFNLADACRRAGVPAASVIIELTESGAANLHSIIECVARFRLLDFRIAIDDFGTGHSSLERLQKVPFTELKIDRSFVTGASRDLDKLSIIESSVQLAHRLRLRVIAEGIEDLDDQRIARVLGCDAAQGYLYMRPDACSVLLSRTERIEAVVSPAARGN
jgi:EAL domain-containing protein (putative c-di-GMP-specific phosphodiesterase class I)/FixJ family two-component response regulator